MNIWTEISKEERDAAVLLAVRFGAKAGTGLTDFPAALRRGVGVIKKHAGHLPDASMTAVLGISLTKLKQLADGIEADLRQRADLKPEPAEVKHQQH